MGAQHGVAQGRSSLGLCRGEARGCAGAQQRAVPQGRSSVRLRSGAAWGRAWAQHGAAQGPSMKLRRGAA